MSINQPLRMCCVCRQRFPKSTLIRFTRFSNLFSLDKSGKADGRGCYICNTQSCLKKAEKSKALQRSYKAPVPIELYKLLQDYDCKP